MCSYGVVSAKETIVEELKQQLAREFNEKALVPQDRDVGHISVTAKARASAEGSDERGTSEGLRVNFALIRRTEAGDLVPEMSTVELDYTRPLEGAEEAFMGFVRLCIGIRY